MPEDVDPRDEGFDPRRGPIYLRGLGSDPKRKVISWMPVKGQNRRLSYIKASWPPSAQMPTRPRSCRLLGLFHHAERRMVRTDVAEGGG